MQFTLVDMHYYLRADLLERETAEETEEFLTTVKEAGLQHPSCRILICVYSPRAIFRVERYHASMFIDELAAKPWFKVALVSKHFEVRLVHQYLELLARSRQADLRSFANEHAAIDWLTIPKVAPVSIPGPRIARSGSDPDSAPGSEQRDR